MTNSDDVAGYQDILTGSHDSPSPAQAPGSSASELRSLLGVAVGTLVIAALYFGKEVLVPITLAVMLSFILSPVVNFLQRLRLWRAPAVILTVLAALALLGIVATVIGSQAAALSANAPQYAKTIEAKVEGVQGLAIAKLASVTKQLGVAPGPRPAPATNTKSPASAATTPAPAAGGARQPVPVEVVQGQTSPFAIARAVLAPILSPLETTILVVIVAIFVLMQKEDLRDRFIRLFGSNDLHRTTRAMDDAGQRLSKYFLSQFAVNTCFGIVIALGLWVIGIPSAAMWGLMAGLLRFVPYIGSLLAAVAPAALGAAIDPGWGMAIEVVVLFFVVEPLTGYVVEPMLYGHSTGLSPVSVIISAIFWTWVWGPIGLILSTPLTLCLVVMGRYVKSLEFFDVLLGDRPALTPVESFYQRILANNPDEALAQAEALLGNRPLAEYYDDVVVPSLKLAVEDQAKGTIDAARAEEMSRSMLSVIEDLQDHVEHGAARNGLADVSAAAGLVACVAGNGPFDNVVSTMLTQLLTQSGVPCLAVTNAMASRETITQLDLGGVKIILIAYLELVGSPAALRYLIKRLRQRAPAARIIVGLWPQGETALTDAGVQHAIGANACVARLRAALDAVVSERRAAAVPSNDAA